MILLDTSEWSVSHTCISAFPETSCWKVYRVPTFYLCCFAYVRNVYGDGLGFSALIGPVLFQITGSWNRLTDIFSMATGLIVNSNVYLQETGTKKQSSGYYTILVLLVSNYLVKTMLLSKLQL